MQESGKTKLSKASNGNILFNTSLVRGLPLSDKRLLQSFLWLSAENDRHIGWRDDDVDDIFALHTISRQLAKEWKENMKKQINENQNKICDKKLKVKIEFKFSVLSQLVYVNWLQGEIPW